VAGWWLERYERRVDRGERRTRPLEIHSYYLKRKVLPLLGSRLIREVQWLKSRNSLSGCVTGGARRRPFAGALKALNNVTRFAVRNNWLAESPVEKLERHEHPRPERHPQRALGREEIAQLLTSLTRATGCEVHARPHRQCYQVVVDYHAAQCLVELLAAHEASLESVPGRPVSAGELAARRLPATRLIASPYGEEHGPDPPIGRRPALPSAQVRV
jgi:hypothetical protein